MITAKIKCMSKTVEYGATVLRFAPDYDDGRNAEWAEFTPALSLSMNVKPEVAERFEVGTAYTLTFEPADS